ncbi:MAG: type II secretion system protein [Candidatus Aenigmatarchaeota archaeon]
MKGFTLIETIFVLTIIGVVLTSFIFLINNLSNLNTYIIFGLGSQGNLELTLKEISKELKSMNYSNNGIYPIQEIGKNNIIFYSDIEDDGLVEKISYYVDNDNIFKKNIYYFNTSTNTYDQLPKISKELVKNLATTSVFTFYDDNSTETVDISKIRYIKVNLAIYLKYPSEIYENYIILNPRNLREK